MNESQPEFSNETSVQLSDRDRDILLELLESDPPPNAALEAAMKHHHELIVRQKPGKTEESHHAT